MEYNLLKIVNEIYMKQQIVQEKATEHVLMTGLTLGGIDKGELLDSSERPVQSADNNAPLLHRC